jgi:hypothetical protein
VSFMRRIVGSLFPKEQVPASIPPTPREAGTTLTPIVAFPCVRKNFRREYSGCCKFDTAQRASADGFAIERSRCSAPWLFCVATRPTNPTNAWGNALDWTQAPQGEIHDRSEEDDY